MVVAHGETIKAQRVVGVGGGVWRGKTLRIYREAMRHDERWGVETCNLPLVRDAQDGHYIHLYKGGNRLHVRTKPRQRRDEEWAMGGQALRCDANDSDCAKRATSLWGP